MRSLSKTPTGRIVAGPVSPRVGSGSHLLRVVACHDRSRFDALPVDLDEISAEWAAAPNPAFGETRLQVLDSAGDFG